MRSLHVGCGRVILPDAVNHDLVPLPGVDVCADLEHPLPFRDRTFDRVIASHVVEHVDRFLELIGELVRVTRPGGRLCVTVPHLSFYGAYTDPTHRRFFGYRSFDYFTEESIHRHYSPTRLRVVRREIRFFWRKSPERERKSRVLSALINAMPGVYERFLCWMLPANEIYFELEPLASPSESPETSPARRRASTRS